MTTAPDAEARAAAVFEALADPTRRAVLRDVAAHGPCTATELAASLPVTRQAVAKHLAGGPPAAARRASAPTERRPHGRLRWCSVSCRPPVRP